MEIHFNCILGSIVLSKFMNEKMYMTHISLLFFVNIIFPKWIKCTIISLSLENQIFYLFICFVELSFCKFPMVSNDKKHVACIYSISQVVFLENNILCFYFILQTLFACFLVCDLALNCQHFCSKSEAF